MGISHSEAVRKAKFGKRDWICIPTADGHEFEPLTVRGIKRALLAAGTKGRFTVIGRAGVHYAHSWRVGINMIRNAHHIGIPA